MSEYDSAFVFMPLAEAQAYFNRAGDVDRDRGLSSTIPTEVGAVRQLVDRAPPSARSCIVDWQQRNATFFNALEVERNVMFLILTLIIAGRRLQHHLRA